MAIFQYSGKGIYTYVIKKRSMRIFLTRGAKSFFFCFFLNNDFF